MTKTEKILPLYSHSYLTRELMEGCLSIYAMNRKNDCAETRQLEFSSTRQICNHVLDWVPDALSMRRFDYLSIVKAAQKPEKWYQSKRTALAHDQAIMQLRAEIGTNEFAPWDENKVHFWDDFDVMYFRLNDYSKSHVNAFFKLLIGKTYKELTDWHRLTLPTNNKHVESQQYIEFPHTEGLIRADVAYHQFSVSVGESETIPDEIEKRKREIDLFQMLTRNKLKPPSTENSSHPVLRNLSLKDLGTPLASLEDCIINGFESHVAEHHQRKLLIKYRDAELIEGYLQRGSFSPTDIKPINTLQASIPRQFIIDALSKGQSRTGVAVRLDNLFSGDLGL